MFCGFPVSKRARGRWYAASGHRPGHRPGPCDGPGPGHGPGRGPGPSRGHVQAGPDRRPSNPERIVLHRNKLAPIQPPRMVAESNNLHATCTCACDAFAPGTNNRLPTRTRDLVLEAELGPQGEAVAGQF